MSTTPQHVLTEPAAADSDPEEAITVVFSRVTDLPPTVTHPICGSILISQYAYDQFRSMGRKRGNFARDERQSEVVTEMGVSFACAESIGRDHDHRVRLYDADLQIMFIIGFRVLRAAIAIKTVADGPSGKKIPISARAYENFRELCIESGDLSKEATEEQTIRKMVECLHDTTRRLRDDQQGNLVYTNWGMKLRFIVDPHHYLVLMVYDMPDDRDDEDPS